MPRSARTGIISSSLSWSTRDPFTQTTPSSARSSPVMIFRIVDFPEPLAPRMIFVWPLIRVKLMSLSTTFSSNASLTRSNTMTGAPVSLRISLAVCSVERLRHEPRLTRSAASA